MDQNMKKELKAYFDAPKPLRKNEFLRVIKPTKISTFHVLLTQCTYISKVTWCFSFIFFIASLLIEKYIPSHLLGVLYSFVPFLVMVSTIEFVRSELYNMSELEMVTRFSLKSVVMMRMCILGIGNIALLVLIVLFSKHIMWRSLIYMFVPYFATAFCSLRILRKVNSKDGTYYCGGVAVFISLLSFIIYEQYSFIYSINYLGIWIVACILLLFFTLNEGYRTIRMTEDLIWN